MIYSRKGYYSHDHPYLQLAPEEIKALIKQGITAGLEGNYDQCKYNFNLAMEKSVKSYGEISKEVALCKHYQFDLLRIEDKLMESLLELTKLFELERQLGSGFDYRYISSLNTLAMGFRDINENHIAEYLYLWSIQEVEEHGAEYYLYVYYNYGSFLGDVYRHSEAIDAYRTFINRDKTRSDNPEDPIHANAHTRLASQYRYKGATEKANKQYKLGIELHHLHPFTEDLYRAYHNFGVFLSRSNSNTQRKEAANWFYKAIILCLEEGYFRNLPDLHSSLFDEYFGAGMLKEGLEVVSRIRKELKKYLLPEQKKIHFKSVEEIAYRLETYNYHQESILQLKQLKKELDSDSEFLVKCNYQIGNLYTELKDWENALLHYSEILELVDQYENPEDVISEYNLDYSKRTYAWCLLETNQLDRFDKEANLVFSEYYEENLWQEIFILKLKAHLLKGEWDKLISEINNMFDKYEEEHAHPKLAEIRSIFEEVIAADNDERISKIKDLGLLFKDSWYDKPALFFYEWLIYEWQKTASPDLIYVWYYYANYLKNESEHIHAKEAYLYYLKHAKSTQNQTSIYGLALLELGETYNRLENNEETEKYLVKAVEWLEEHSYVKELGEAYQSIATFCHEQDNFEKTIHYFQLSNELCVLEGLDETLLENLQTIIEVYFEFKEYKKGIETIQRYKYILREKYLPHDLRSYMQEFRNVDYVLKSYEHEEALITEFQELSQLVNEYDLERALIAEQIAGLGDIYYKQQKWEEALKFYREILELETQYTRFDYYYEYYDFLEMKVRYCKSILNLRTTESIEELKEKYFGENLQKPCQDEISYLKYHIMFEERQFDELLNEAVKIIIRKIEEK